MGIKTDICRIAGFDGLPTEKPFNPAVGSIDDSEDATVDDSDDATEDLDDIDD